MAKVNEQGKIWKLLNTIDELTEALQSQGPQLCKAVLIQIVQRIDLKEDLLTAQVDFSQQFRKVLGLADLEIPAVEISSPIRLARRGAELKLILKGAAGATANQEPNLIQAVLDARRRFRSYTGDNDMTLSQIAEMDSTDTAEVSRSLQLAFLAPSLVSAILDGRQPHELTATKLKRLDKLPLLWEDQRVLFS